MVVHTYIWEHDSPELTTKLRKNPVLAVQEDTLQSHIGHRAVMRFLDLPDTSLLIVVYRCLNSLLH